MIKLSFKGEDSKKVEHFNNKVTTVTVKAVIIGLNTYDVNYSNEIWNWTVFHPVITTGFKSGMMTIQAEGKAKCSEEDEFDPVKGERIAEARAKLRLYRFMSTLLYKLTEFHSIKAFGRDSNILVQDETGFHAGAKKFEELVGSERKHLNKLLDS